MSNRFKVVKQLEQDIYYEDFKVKIYKDSIVYDKYRDKTFLKLNIKNISDKDIKDIDLIIEYIGKNGKLLGDSKNISLKFIELKKGESLSEPKMIPLEYEDTTDISIAIEDVEFEHVNDNINLDDEQHNQSVNHSIKVEPNKLEYNKSEYNKRVSNTHEYSKRESQQQNYAKQSSTNSIKPINKSRSENKKSNEIIFKDKKIEKNNIKDYLSTKDIVKKFNTNKKVKKDKKKISSIIYTALTILFLIYSFIDPFEDNKIYDDYYSNLSTLVENINTHEANVKDFSVIKFFGEDNLVYENSAVFLLSDDGYVNYYSTDEETYDFEEISNWSNIVSISSVDTHLVALKGDGTALSIGENIYGEGDLTDWNDLKYVSAGDNSTVGIKNDGTVLFKGKILNKENYSDYHFDQSEWIDISEIAFLNQTIIGLKNDGHIVYAGENEDYKVLSNWNNIKKIYTSANSGIVGLKNDGTVVSLGYDEYEEEDMSSWKDIVNIYANSYNLAGLKSDGKMLYSGFFEHKDEVNDLGSITQIYTGDFNTDNSNEYNDFYEYTIVAKDDQSVEVFSEISEYSLDNLKILKGLKKVYTGDSFILAVDNVGNIAAENIVAD